MEVSYGESPVHVPNDATNTDITTYMWPGFLGEFDHEALSFTAWELTGPTTWTLRPDIIAPPYTCIGVASTVTQTWVLPQKGEQWSRQGSLWRCLRLSKTIPLRPPVAMTRS